MLAKYTEIGNKLYKIICCEAISIKLVNLKLFDLKNN